MNVIFSYQAKAKIRIKVKANCQSADVWCCVRN